MAKKRTPRDYKFLRLLGEGSFSSVYLGVDAEKLTRKYAIKVCHKQHIKRQNKQVAIMREKEIMNMFNQTPNQHFVKLYCTFQDLERLYFVMSYAAYGDLLTYMQENPLQLETVRRYTLQLVDALEHMHRLGIVHRDLKPENILLDERKDLLISDFGSAQIYKTPLNSPPLPAAELPPMPPITGSETTITKTSPLSTLALIPKQTTEQRRNSFVGTAQYVSPEMLKYRQASNKSDLWALGLIIYQMHTNLMPFNAPNEYLVYQKIQNLDFSYTDGFDAGARDIVDALVKLDPLTRLGALDNVHEDGYVSIRHHSFIACFVNNEGTQQAKQLGDNECELPETDPDLVGLDKISAGLDETQLLRLLTVG